MTAREAEQEQLRRLVIRCGLLVKLAEVFRKEASRMERDNTEYYRGRAAGQRRVCDAIHQALYSPLERCAEMEKYCDSLLNGPASVCWTETVTLEERLKDGDFTDCGSVELCLDDPPCDFHDRDFRLVGVL